MKYFLIAGEPSGDMHAATLMAELKIADPEASFQYFGGNLMQAQGGQLLRHYNSMAFMGILPVLLNLKAIQRNFKHCEKALLAFRPDVLILIDYPGFNLRMARFAKQHQIQTSYYISPKIWAWKTKRVHKVKAYVDNMYTIFPFETNFYNRFNYRVEYVGNPVYDSVHAQLKKTVDIAEFCTANQLNNKPIIALLAGSRTEEIKLLLPVMEQLCEYYPNYQFVVAGAPSQSIDFYQSILKSQIPVIYNQTYDLLRVSSAAVVASGTATLETALLNTPQVVVYKMGLGWFLELFRKQILKTKYFSLVNLVAEKDVVKELFQSEVNVDNLKLELNKLLNEENYRTEMQNEYKLIGINLKTEGAAIKAAQSIYNSLKKK